MAIQKKTTKYKYKATGKGAQNLEIMANAGWRLIAVDDHSFYFEIEA